MGETTDFDKICIIDFGSQYTHLISRRIREINVYSEIIVPGNINFSKIKKCKGIILSGGPDSIYKKDSVKINKKILEFDIPVLGICYGMQFISYFSGGIVKPGIKKEYGKAEIKIINKNSIFKGLSDKEIVWMSHGDCVSKIPEGFNISAKTDQEIIAGMENHEKKIYGVQFHPEVVHTVNGMKILKNFILNICKCRQNWTMEHFLDEIQNEIKSIVKKRKVFMLVSGGVDSTVSFALLEKVLGEKKVYGLHIDNGFMRKNESEFVKRALEKIGFENFHVADYSIEFLAAVSEVTDPEKKRNIIGKKFIDVQKKELSKLNLDEKNWILGQGTIYPDTIESSGTKHADLIKTHHNRVPIIQKMIREGRIIEPISHLYKDEVRELGRIIGLPVKLIDRHPFPGPGLSIRCLCSDGKSELLDQDYANKINKSEPDYEISVLPVKSVGVQGDERSYKHCALIQGELIWKQLGNVSTRLTNKFFEINRVVFQLHPNNNKLIKIKKALLTKKRLDLLREIDHNVNKIIKNYGLMEKIWQFPIILIPIGYNHMESVVLRPVHSKEAMTANFFHIKKDILQIIIKKIRNYDIDYIFYDITNKPPGTIEWE
ncbi:glutamine-hydrolyzing GMP synthase [Candidatus Woesearchaeota archaeon]|nr:glutamine-hydrolyzing GMP synthase [Candidatus Woesearchaeota archaeon]